MCSDGIRSPDCSDSSPFCEIFPCTDVYRWNAVDVENAHGLLERGQVINTVPRGLLVDFGVPGRRSQFVEYKKAQHYLRSQESCIPFSADWKAEHSRAPIGIQVLSRTAADRPWTWNPAVHLLHRVLWDQYACVAIHLDNGIILKLVSILVVRLAEPFGGARAVLEGDYVTQACALPWEYRAGWPLEPALWSLWVEGLMSAPDCTAYPVCVTNGNLLYLQDRCRSANLAPVSEDALNQLNGMAKAEMAWRLQTGWTYTDGQWTRPKTNFSISASLRAAPAQISSQLAAALPPELWREILSCCATNERAFYCRVSPLWDAVIKQDAVRRRLTLTFGNAGTANRSVGMCIIQYVTTLTEEIVISDARQSSSLPELSDCLRLLSFVYEQRGNRRKKLQVLINRCRWDLGDRFPTEMQLLARTLSDAASAMNWIGWRNCRFGGIGGEYYELTVASDFTAVRNTMMEMQTNLYELLERNLWWLEQWFPLDAFGLVQWIAGAAWRNETSDSFATINAILLTYQCSDPRPTNRYRGKYLWTVEELRGLDLTTVSSLTLWVVNMTMLSRRQLDQQPSVQRGVWRPDEL
ncbi:uncharacterized protein LOC129586023 [Paramacrobiotus metropolitanus]|uniref:uncharacterized protein LOC129586023 n=1 Tax=Paramacrobiotus metropolitanus TaxID=2943436 RepID=UPI002445778A|nr:uncharacterized protein LOC129586023 [Paramacrobiotus metropolitanus]